MSLVAKEQLPNFEPAENKVNHSISSINILRRIILKIHVRIIQLSWYLKSSRQFLVPEQTQ